MKLALVAGHYKGTPGKRCLRSLDPNETREWELNSRICEKVEKLLGDSVEILRLDDRTGEENITLEERAKASDRFGADLYLSIHHNAGVGGGPGGGIVAFVGTTPKDEAIRWQKELYTALIEDTGLKGNRAEPMPRRGLYECRIPKAPSVLLEMGFMDSSTDTPIILTEEYADQCAGAIARVLLEKEKGEQMKTVTGATASEKKMIKGVQEVIGAVEDGMIGTQTMSDIACVLKAECFPLTLEIYSNPVIIARDILPFSPGTGVSKWSNCMSGSFTASGKPCSILVSMGVTKRSQSCHSWKYNKPESVLYKNKGGEIKIARVVDVKEIKDDIEWAVGGMGLLGNYDPKAEGFTKLTYEGKSEDFSDVLRKTNHTMLGEKNGYLYLCYVKNTTGEGVNNYAKKLGLSKAIMLDGGHIAAMNGEESFSRLNGSQKQYYAIQGVK